jgi:hypothetical protein
MTRVARVQAVVLLVALIGCASIPAHYQLDQRISLRAIEVQRATQAVMTAADIAAQADALSRTDAARVAQIGLHMGIEGQRLAIVLIEIDRQASAFETGLAIGRAQTIVQSMQTAITQVPDELPPAVATAVAALLTALDVIAREVEGG